MMFGKSNAKVYVKSSEGIKFSDVAGEDEAKENLAEIVDYLHNPDKYKEIGASMPNMRFSIQIMWWAGIPCTFTLPFLLRQSK